MSEILENINIMWFRQDLRISDNPAFFEAAKNKAILPIYIVDDKAAGEFKEGDASKKWLYNSLRSLNESLDGNLNIYHGDAKEIILRIIKNHKISGVYFNRCYEPWRIKNDNEIKASLDGFNIECHNFNASLLWEPWDVVKKDSSFYKIYTAFYKYGCLKSTSPRVPLNVPLNYITVKDRNSDDSDSLLKNNNLGNGWKAGEKFAQERLFEFLDNGFTGYAANRDYLSKNNLSKLSPHLHFGEISPNQIWYQANTTGLMKGLSEDLEKFLSEIAWREFSYYLLYHFPGLPKINFQKKFDLFPWKHDQKLLNTWQDGKTGYPIVDAGMRELKETGFMHNRVRMIVASFLVKNLGIHWNHGERWFWNNLFDADLANNSASWQWVAGCGCDSSPYFRIFNAILQGEQFDSDGEYTKKWVPELKKLPNKFLFKPWEASKDLLESYGVFLGVNYPNPIVDISISRDKALKAYNYLRISAI